MGNMLEVKVAEACSYQFFTPGMIHVTPLSWGLSIMFPGNEYSQTGEKSI